MNADHTRSVLADLKLGCQHPEQRQARALASWIHAVSSELAYRRVVQISSLGDEDLQGCPSLAELRLGHNELTRLPAALSSCSRLKIVDLGSNHIADVRSMQVGTHRGCWVAHCLTLVARLLAVQQAVVRCAQQQATAAHH